MSYTLEMKHSTFTAPFSKTTRSAIGKRLTGGVEYNIAELPANVVTALLTEKIEEFLQDGLKALDKDNCTVEQAQAAMKARLELLKAGAIGTAAARKAPTQDPVRKEAKTILKAALQDQSDEKIDGRVLLATVNALFKVHGEWEKAKKKGDEDIVEALADRAALVENALATARERMKENQKISGTLAGVLAEAKKAAAAAAAKAEAKPAKPKASPTEKVKAEKAAAGKKPAAR